MKGRGDGCLSGLYLTLRTRYGAVEELHLHRSHASAEHLDMGTCPLPPPVRESVPHKELREDSLVRGVDGLRRQSLRGGDVQEALGTRRSRSGVQRFAVHSPPRGRHSCVAYLVPPTW